MKKLDEVIKAFEYTYENDPIAWTYGVDALHYLKEYRDLKETMDWHEEMENIRNSLTNLLMNPPLTWEELRQMEGKPVWVEILSDEIDLSSRWMMVARETKAHSLPLAYTDDIGHWIYGHEDKLGKTWQAYRKEKYEES